MNARWSIAGALGGAAVMWLVLGSGAPAATPTPPPSSSTTAARINVANYRDAAGNASIDMATLRAAIRDEMAAASEAKAATAAEPTPEPTPAQAAAAEEAATVLDNAVAVGRWTSADEDRLRQLGAELHPDAHAEVMLAWARAVNEQKLSIP